VIGDVGQTRNNDITINSMYKIILIFIVVISISGCYTRKTFEALERSRDQINYVGSDSEYHYFISRQVFRFFPFHYRVSCNDVNFSYTVPFNESVEWMAIEDIKYINNGLMLRRITKYIYKNRDPIIVSPIIDSSKTAQQGDAPEPASPAR
jgi:hypothetical protein